MLKYKVEPFLVYYPMELTHRLFVPSPDSDDYDNFTVADKGDSKSTISDTTYFKDEVAYMDKVLGEIVDKVHELGISKNTLILFTGDNGTGRELVSTMKGGEKIPGMKGLTNKYGRHVPLVGYWDGMLDPGQVNNNLIDFSVFLPNSRDYPQFISETSLTMARQPIIPLQ